MGNLEEIYNQRYSGDYRDTLSGYEIARYEALSHFIRHVLKLGDVDKALDYGAGSGLHVKLWESLFPETELYFCDISEVARNKFNDKYHGHARNYRLMNDGLADFPDASFDVIMSIEVMEHVQNLEGYLSDIQRLLKPGGTFIWTTPCANMLSIEHLYSAATCKIDKTHEGYRRWSWEDEGHIRRLTSREAYLALVNAGFNNIRFRFRAHLFSFLCTHLLPGRYRKYGERLMTLDYRLFRILPNAASMIGAATKFSSTSTVHKKKLALL